jgi:hypothetical protein
MVDYKEIPNPSSGTAQPLTPELFMRVYRIFGYAKKRTYSCPECISCDKCDLARLDELTNDEQSENRNGHAKNGSPQTAGMDNGDLLFRY